MYKGYTDKAKGLRFEGERQGWVGVGHVGVKMETTVLEHNKKKRNYLVTFVCPLLAIEL